METSAKYDLIQMAIGRNPNLDADLKQMLQLTAKLPRNQIQGKVTRADLQELWKDFPKERQDACSQFMFKEKLMINAPYDPTAETLLTSWLASNPYTTWYLDNAKLTRYGHIEFDQKPDPSVAYQFMMWFAIYANPMRIQLYRDAVVGILSNVWYEFHMHRIAEGIIDFRCSSLSGQYDFETITELIRNVFEKEPYISWVPRK